MAMAMDKWSFIWGISVCMCFHLSFTHEISQNSLVTYLPGFNGTFPSKHYSGYITFDDKNLFHYFVVSEKNPSKDPVVRWLNGGPACSSLQGFTIELGPFLYRRNSNQSLPTLHLNPYSWSKVSNIIYLDSPCGTGLSYSKNTSKYTTNDNQTVADIHSFLLKWFKQYPKFITNPFYISGESYAGIHIPMLASSVVKGIKAGLKPNINFKGYMIGNGVVGTDYYLDDKSTFKMLNGIGIVPDEILKEVKAACRGDYDDPNPSVKCQHSLYKMWKLGVDSVDNQYDFVDTCPEHLTPHDYQIKRNIFCDINVAEPWLNNVFVRKAIHAESISVAGPWIVCTERVNYTSPDGIFYSMLPYHKNLTAEGYRALIYSGNTDLIVPFTSTQEWTESLKYRKETKWGSWISNQQIAGFLQEYDNNLTFLIIKGAGHMVSMNKPKEAFDLYSRWLNRKPI